VTLFVCCSDLFSHWRWRNSTSVAYQSSTKLSKNSNTNLVSFERRKYVLRRSAHFSATVHILPHSIIYLLCPTHTSEKKRWNEKKSDFVFLWLCDEKDISHRLPNVAEIINEVGINVFLVEYRGSHFYSLTLTHTHTHTHTHALSFTFSFTFTY
jgi:hypothetical protein